ncbi:putative minor capsid protein [Enterococcus thailandicus]|uniref:putative minor capsid protein n=1 Tax=Enterococcus thailandicus TaxID=417368 RepID=UPI00288DBC74|nr:putative minor capsid protein [Enterococcus thailandicus]MDT2776660.1 putative minor capsid protein [Enterococcus thailandicus]
MIPQMPKEFCNQSIILSLKKGTDKWQKPIFEDDITIENMIFQPQTVYSGSNNNRKVVANAIAFLFSNVSSPMPEISKEHVGSDIIFEGKTYSLVTIVDNRNPFSNEVYSYELEVL